MSRVERCRHLATHQVRGRQLRVEVTEWADPAGVAFHVYDEVTGLCLTPRPLDHPPTGIVVRRILDDLADARRHATLDPFYTTDPELAAELDAVLDAVTTAPPTPSAVGADPVEPPPAGPEPDACRVTIARRPSTGELGAQAFGRDIAEHLARLLHGPITSMLYRENPWDRRRCPCAWFYCLHVADRRIQITAYDTRHPLRRDSFTAYAVTLDDEPVPLELNKYEPAAWQLARAIWIATFDTPGHRS